MSDLAIIGMACHLPGASDKYDFWHNLVSNAAAITPVPVDRQGFMSAANIHAGFIERYAYFDADFFGISRKEASYMDPQQRLLLQVVYQAIEDAGLSAAALSGQAVGVYVGVMGNDWGRRLFRDTHHMDIYSGTGNGHSMVANRISYVFNFCGPSVAIDTACSSSLVALDCACRALAAGEIDVAVVGGVNIILDSVLNVFYSKAGLSSQTHRCQPFGRHADGIVRGEGAAAVILSRRAQIPALPARTYAYIKSHSVNHNGMSNGITAPKRWAQQAVITRALQQAGVKAQDICYVEAHGTGTKLGDPIEAHALSDAIGQYKLHHKPLLLGSVKGNIGHLEGAAGIAGLIKAALAMYYRMIPASLHFNQGNTYIDFSRKQLRVVTENIDLSHSEHPLYFGVSSLGLGGTNAHVILAAADEYRVSEQRTARPLLLKCSAKSEFALNNQIAANCHFEHYANETDYVSTLNHKADYPHRRCVLRQEQQGYARVNPYDTQAQSAKHSDRSIAFLFAGQSVQYAGMAKGLYANSLSFRQKIDALEYGFTKKVGISLRRALLDEDYKAIINATEYTQPVLFTLGYVLASMWLTLGVKPSYLMGHSLGEYTALCIAGVFDFDVGLSLVVERARLMSQADNGGMLLLVASLTEVKTLLETAQSQLDISVINHARNIVVSGSSSELDHFSRYLTSKGIAYKTLNVSGAFHSRLMTQAAGEFQSFANNYQFKSPKYPVISNVTGKAIGTVDGNYLAQHIMSPVQYEMGLHTLSEKSAGIYLEIGPGNDLLQMAAPTLAQAPIKIPSLSRLDDYKAFLTAVGRLYEAGVDIDWSQLYSQRTLSDVPVYCFDGQLYPPPDHNESARKDQQALSEHQQTQPRQEIPGTSVRLSKLKHIIADVSGKSVDHIKLDSHFIYDLGFDSLMMVSLRNQINQAGVQQKNHQLADLIQLKTVGDLLEYVNTNNRAASNANH